MCGIFGFIGRPPKRSNVVKAVSGLRHRGSVGFGYWWRGVSGRTAYHRETDPGQCQVAFDGIEQEDGVFIAHWRYSTSGGDALRSVQPMVGRGANPVLAHNGQFLLPLRGDRSDTEIIFQDIVEHTHREVSDQSIEAMFRRHDGAFSLVCYLDDQFIAARDTHGFRPIFIGRYDGGVAASSETLALETIGCSRIEELPPGHWAKIDPKNDNPSRAFGTGKLGLCSFEHIYFHSRDGRLNGKPVSAWRERLGMQLAAECPVHVDLVTPVPNSGRDAALGYANAIGGTYCEAIKRTPTAERTFIATAETRQAKLSRKYVFDVDLVVGRNVCVIDDSVVRGTTLRFVSDRLRSCGAASVHARIAAPKFRYPCFFGIDVPARSELAVAKFSHDELVNHLGVDSLEFLSVSGLHKALDFGSLCTGCFTSRYPISNDKIRKKAQQPLGVDA